MNESLEAKEGIDMHRWTYVVRRGGIVFWVVLFCLSWICFSENTAAARPEPPWITEVQPDVLIYVNLWHRQLSLIQDGRTVKTYRIAPGTPDTPTPIGHFRIVHKSADWGGGFGTRWLGLDVPFGTYGIHGTNKPHLIGQSVSSGCIRMRNQDVEELYDLVPLNTPVHIDGPILGAEGLNYRILVQGSRGSLVQMVQNRLKAGHYYDGPVNGLYGPDTERAVQLFQQDHHLLVTGQIHFADLVELGIVE